LDTGLSLEGRRYVAADDVRSAEAAVAANELAAPDSAGSVDRVPRIPDVRTERTIGRLEVLVAARIGIDVDDEGVVTLDLPAKARSTSLSIRPDAPVIDFVELMASLRA